MDEKKEIEQFEEEDVKPAIDERTKAIISAVAVIVVNLVAFVFGKNIDAGIVTDGLLAIVLLISTFWGIWKNHNFTPEAAEAQQVLNALKAEKKEEKLEGKAA